MAVPKRKTSKSRRDKRRATHAIEAPRVNTCPQCGSPKRAHRICPTCGTPYHVITDPPREPGVCDKDGTALRPRDDDRPEVVRARLERQVPPMLEVVDHYERAGIVDRLDGTQTIDRVTEAILSRIGTVARS